MLRSFFAASVSSAVSAHLTGSLLVFRRVEPACAYPSSASPTSTPQVEDCNPCHVVWTSGFCIVTPTPARPPLFSFSFSILFYSILLIPFYPPPCPHLLPHPNNCRPSATPWISRHTALLTWPSLHSTAFLPAHLASAAHCYEQSMGSFPIYA